MRRTRRFSLTAIGLMVASSGPALAEAVLDGSTGSTGSFSGMFEVPHTVGRIEGGNLFHSFERFGIRRGESATFTGPHGIANVVTRVTGDGLSRINGPLASSVPGANFFFLNPNGVVFGPNASLDVDGSFHVSTADELRFADGTRLSAREPSSGLFTSAAPEAFGFLGADAGAITVDRGRLVVAAGQTLSLVGGPIDIQGIGADTGSADQAGFLRAPSGRIRLASAADEGEINIVTGDATPRAGFDVVVTSGAQVDSGGNGGGGDVRVFAGRLIIEDQAMILADNMGPSASAGGIFITARDVGIYGGGRVAADARASGDTGRVSIQAGGTVEITDGGQISSSTFAAGDAGTVRVEAKRLLVTHGGSEPPTGIFSQAEAGSRGDGGAVTISVDRVRLLGGGAISSSTGGSGSAGPVSVVANELRIVGDGVGLRVNGIVSEAFRGDTGAAGPVRVRANRLVIRNGGWIGSDTFGSGNAGIVSVTAEQLLISGDAVEEGFTGIFSSPSVTDRGERATGAGGAVQVTAAQITLKDGGVISSSTFADGDAGAVIVTANELQILDGATSTPGIFSEAATGATGNAGQVVVRADTLELLRGGQVVGSTHGEGDSGALTVQVGSLLIDGDGLITGIQSDARPGATGSAGPLLVRANTIAILEGGRITSDTFASDPAQVGGNAGAVIVEADRIEIGGFGNDGFTGISSNALPGSSGNAGNVLVTAGTLEIERGGFISSETFGEGDAGQVVVATNEGVTRGNIATGSTTAAAAGTLVLSAPVMRIEGGGQVTSSGSGEGPAGDIIIISDQVEVDNGLIQTEGRTGGRIRLDATERLLLVGAEINSNGIAPGAGDSIITVQAGTIVVNSSVVTSLTGDGQPITGSGEAILLGELTVISPDSQVAASSRLEVSGLESDITAGIEVLPGAFLDVSGQLRESCAARASQDVSSFVQTGHRAVSSEIDGALPGRYAVLGGAVTATTGPPEVWRHALSAGGCER